MNRCIYNFYCYQCYQQHVAKMSYPLDIENGKINYIFCPGCNTWVHFCKTNLSENRFKIVRKNNWNIIDEDSLDLKCVYTLKNYNIAQNICDALNNDLITVSQLNYSSLLFQSIY